MKTRRRWLASLVAASGLVFAFGSSPASADLYKCQQGIEKESVKIQGLILKALQLCKDKYRQTLVKVNASGGSLSMSTELPKVTKACDGLLAKTVGVPGGNLATLGTPPSQVQKTYQKLAGLLAGTSPKCTDSDLAALGHLPSAAFGDAWIRWLMTTMLKAAYEKQIWIVADTPGVMAALCDANGNGTPGEPAGTTGDCPTCCKLQVPPCNKMNCRLKPGGSNSFAQVQLLDSGLPITIALGKELVSEYCQYPDFIGSDIAVVGNPSRTIDEITAIPGNTVCITQLRASGFIKCGASSVFSGPKDVALCADSNGGACNAGSCLPQPTATSSCGSPPPGGPLQICQQLSGTAATNDSVVLSHLQIEVAPSGCTGAGGNVVPTVLTTGQVTVSFDNYDATCTVDYSNTLNGTAGTCPSGFFDSADLAGTVLVGGFPSYQSPSSTLGDTATTFRLECEQ